MRRIPEALHAAGFALLEIGVAMLVLAALVSGLALPLAARVDLHRQAEARRLLEEARDALMGFAAAHGRLPCPASAASAGLESFGAGGSEANGLCSNFYDGYLPGAALGLAPLDAEGFVRDPWMTPGNRVRYAVYGGTINGIDNALTRTDGMQAATLAGLGSAPHYLFICASGAAATSSGCGPASQQLTRRAAFLVLSLGPDGPATPAPASDEAKNLDGDAVFVAHERSQVAGAAFDDLVLWAPIHLVTHRLLVAGRLP